MSHVVKVQLKITNLDTLAEACEELGLVLVRGQQTHKSFASASNKCEHAIRAKNHEAGDYEIGLVKADDGAGYVPAYDNWGRSGAKLDKLAGQSLVGLKDAYASRTAQKFLWSKGHRVVRKQLAGGGWQVTAIQS